jgi:hypothetical protein
MGLERLPGRVRFAARAGWRDITVQMLLLSTVSVSIGAVSDCSCELAASGVRAWFARSPWRFELVGGAGGLAMIGVGVTAALTGAGAEAGCVAGGPFAEIVGAGLGPVPTRSATVAWAWA